MIKIFYSGWNNGLERVFLVNLNLLLDVLVLIFLVSKLDVLILFINKNSILYNVIEEIKRFNLVEVILIGSEGVILLSVKEFFEDMEVLVSRIGGVDREEIFLFFIR